MKVTLHSHHHTLTLKPWSDNVWDTSNQSNFFSGYDTTSCMPWRHMGERGIPFHLWHYSPFWSLAFIRKHLHSSLSSVHLLYPLIPRICDVSFQTTSSHLVLGFPIGLVLKNFPFKTFYGIRASSILIIWPAHPSLLISIYSIIFRSLYKL